VEIAFFLEVGFSNELLNTDSDSPGRSFIEMKLENNATEHNCGTMLTVYAGGAVVKDRKPLSWNVLELCHCTLLGMRSLLRAHDPLV